MTQRTYSISNTGRDGALIRFRITGPDVVEMKATIKRAAPYSVFIDGDAITGKTNRRGYEALCNMVERMNATPSATWWEETMNQIIDHCAYCGAPLTASDIELERNASLDEHWQRLARVHQCCPEIARQLGESCGYDARMAGGPDPYDADGNRLLPEEPLDGDWDAFQRWLIGDDREASHEEIEAFERGWRDGMGPAL